MTMQVQSRDEQLQDALIAAELFASDPSRLGGVVVKAYAGPVRSRYLEFLQSRLPGTVPVRKLPLSIQDERLLGGLDLTATLALGKPVLSRGLLAETHGGILLVAMAERMPLALAARLSGVMDRRQVVVARDGVDAEMEAAFGLVLLDESVAEDECVAPELLDRIAFHIDLRDVSHRELDEAISLFESARSCASELPNAAIHLGAAEAPVIGDDITQALWCRPFERLFLRAVWPKWPAVGRRTVTPSLTMQHWRLVWFLRHAQRCCPKTQNSPPQRIPRLPKILLKTLNVRTILIRSSRSSSSSRM
jgi:magnesium chelatase subunit D